ncbi:aggregation-promoting factor C-terminal-like domain-containing protein [Kitasatospora aureofaciens]|uniref:aggregation-promoting factor C-terminal-like domain-containing protein n=1 Tax=Kitasatospora aureofaciens TaxID=1894 RepID=UPI0036F4ADC8
MRTSAAILAGAAGVTALGAAVVPTMASAADASPQAVAARIVPANQLASFSQIISHESGWNVTATNPSSGSYGLGQALPASKMASAGADWKTNPATQIKWALDYMNTRYGSPNAAWAFWQNHHWY